MSCVRRRGRFRVGMLPTVIIMYWFDCKISNWLQCAVNQVYWKGDKSHDCGWRSSNSWLASNYLLFTNIVKIVMKVFPKPMVSSSSCFSVWNLNNNITVIMSKVANVTLFFKQEEGASLWRHSGLNATLAFLHINKITLESRGVFIWL